MTGVDTPKAVIVHDVAQARTVLSVAKALGVAVALRNAPGAVAYLGPRLFLEIAAQARAAVPGSEAITVVDCGANAGDALLAFRYGADRVRIDPEVPSLERLIAIAAAYGAAIDRDPGSALDLLDVPAPIEACRAWLSP